MSRPPFGRSRRDFEQGFSLPELLVAMTILGIVMSQLMLVLVAQNRIYSSQSRSLNAQEDARLVMEMILSDVRVAGFLVAPIVALSSIDGGTAGADSFCASDSILMDEARIAAASGVFQRATIKTSAVGAGAGLVRLSTASTDIDSDGNADFVVNGGIIISDGTGSHCARIQTITIAGTTTTLAFTPNTPAGFSAAIGPTRVVPAFIYEVSGAGLRRNNVLLTPLVENLQIEFGIDADNDGEIEAAEWLDTLAADNPSQIASVRISVITRTMLADPDMPGVGMPPAANHTGLAPDGFTRRRLTATAVPRNVR